MTVYVIHARTRDEHSGDRYQVEANSRDEAIAAYITAQHGTDLPIYRVTTGPDTTTTDT